jgi:hypothetical protein
MSAPGLAKTGRKAAASRILGRNAAVGENTI